MKKWYVLFSLASSLLFSQYVAADSSGQVQPQQVQNARAGTHDAWSQVDQADIPNNQGQAQAYYSQPGAYANQGNWGQQGYGYGQDGGAIVDPASAPQGWERDMGNGYICCCTYKPCYYNTCETVYCPQYHYKKCCRYCPQYYQVQRCRYVPQYYCETCCRQCPQYYYTCECTQCPKTIYHRHCRYEPCYNYRCCPQPCCEPAPCCEQPAAPACNTCQ